MTLTRSGTPTAAATAASISLSVLALPISVSAKSGRMRESAIDVSTLDHRLANARITVMCDVTNPLCGENGATWTFGAQKGATPEMQARLEAGMLNYRDVLRKQFGIDPDAIQGAGAAGGLGAALVFLGGEMKSGIDTVLDLIGFDQRLEGTDLVVTGEGRTDWQSCFGKVMQGVGERAARKGVRAWANAPRGKASSPSACAARWAGAPRRSSITASPR